MRIYVCLSFAFILGIARGYCAQTSEITQVKAPSGVVTGHIFCADTRRPGRFAEVVLLRQQIRPAQSAAEARIVRNFKSNSGEIVYASTWSGLDGAYAIRNVPPGDYLVIARMEGYIVPVQDLTYGDGVDEPFAKMRSEIPVAHVAADETVQVDLTLHRGGVISGRVRFEDATPVVGAVVRVEPAQDVKLNSDATSAPLTEVVGRRYQGTTDDEGQYRIAGLESGKYRVFTMIPLERETWITSYGGLNSQQFSKNSPGSSGKAKELVVYQPKTFRPTEATVFDF
ncbi:MAG TPA: carboxypeptidase-like regulatory domain-containing protein [Edaphobacter sp.]|nr:carboxypeptidase-like regulatory domain-containing protein [Edaphobacter sp.]